jgi:hypothetical protein
MKNIYNTNLERRTQDRHANWAELWSHTYRDGRGQLKVFARDSRTVGAFHVLSTRRKDRDRYSSTKIGCLEHRAQVKKETTQPSFYEPDLEL